MPYSSIRRKIVLTSNMILRGARTWTREQLYSIKSCNCNTLAAVSRENLSSKHTTRSESSVTFDRVAKKKRRQTAIPMTRISRITVAPIQNQFVKIHEIRVSPGPLGDGFQIDYS